MDAVFDACVGRFAERRRELFLRHRSTGVKVDVVPCGRIEAPPGSLALRASTRVLNTAGLAEAFRSARPLDVDGFTVHVPTPSAYVLLKLLSFLDRRAPRDLRDLGHVVRRAPVDEERIWSDDEVLNGLADGRFDARRHGCWQLGRDVAQSFSASTTRIFVDALVSLTTEADAVRTLLVDKSDPDERVEAADRLISVLKTAASERSSTG